MTELIESLSGLSTLIIGACCAVHLFAFLVLKFWSGRDFRLITGTLDDFTRDLRQRSVLGTTGHYSDQIEAFIADVNEVLDDPSRQADREGLLQRMMILDEKRRYLSSMFFETTYNICRTMIEAYPLAGVLGTILAIGTALQSGSGPDETSSVAMIVGRFGDAIWSTFAGLVSAILLMFINSVLEPSFQRLSQNREHVRDMIASSKRALSLNSGEPSA
ncbi:MAG: MotA/TolQ/ExbB proton channel family protein [Planctomycetaceae bacterium]